ncbi:TetR/AcrR family transcriptional regulator [Flavihumibacter petaseus]|uniref:Putative TetR family transcriptional regulator n=1 Tax=Flavihumibacter petaseus NBRC 106054 TaxID=1220578 RepID=A0A0E9MUU7_9BACT|nr:TetR/AcrR family transcriptional regulator [Flavihumibacter petaseus]GAO41268.1 putative TetR family transcriptional regulator [Flavihumibacter petaseus NBRC 106054]
MSVNKDYNEKQGQILTTAESLFSEKGFDGTSVRDIAEKAGVNVAMISYYFGSKEKLMETIFERRTEHIRLRVESLMKDDSIDYIGKVHLIIDEHIEKAFSKFQFYKLMVCEQVINKNPVILDIIKEVKKRNMQVITELIRKGQEAGVFRSDVDVILLFSTMYGTVSHMIIGSDLYREISGLTHLSEEEYYQHLKQLLSKHLKQIFKAILTHEA